MNVFDIIEKTRDSGIDTDWYDLSGLDTQPYIPKWFYFDEEYDVYRFKIAVFTRSLRDVLRMKIAPSVDPFVGGGAYLGEVSHGVCTAPVWFAWPIDVDELWQTIEYYRRYYRHYSIMTFTDSMYNYIDELQDPKCPYTLLSIKEHLKLAAGDEYIIERWTPNYYLFFELLMKITNSHYLSRTVME
jgi:hypothetical protein